MSFPFKLPDRYLYAGERREGGQSYVYVCHDKFLERHVAIKLLKAADRAEALVKEIAAVSEISSQHVVELYDLVVAKKSGVLGLVQEFVPGPSLSECIADLDEAKFFKYLWQIARGIADIHRHKMIHRDIKPDNIRFDSEGVLKILDFGLAMDMNDAKTLQARGSRFFIAPELYATAPVAVSPAVDIYAFGVMVWYLATRGTLPPALQEIPPGRSKPKPLFGSCPMPIPETLSLLFDDCLSSQPSKRPPAARIVESLEQHILFGKHSALITHGGKSDALSVPGKTVRLSAGEDTATILYDGLQFLVSQVNGDVYINNTEAIAGMALPTSCVITLGHPGLKAQRRFVPVDMTHPGVVV